MLRVLCIALLSAAGSGMRMRASITRRSALFGATAALASAPPARAFFESPSQLALQPIASALPRVKSIMEEVTEVNRLRAKRVEPDEADDAYVFRFSQSVLAPLPKLADEVVATLPEDAASLPAALRSHIGALEDACRAKSSERELRELTATADALSSLLAYAKGAKLDTRPTDRINQWEGASGVLYNKFLFRAG